MVMLLSVGVVLLTLWRAPYLGFALVGFVCAGLMGLALPSASGVVYLVILGYTGLSLAGGLWCLYCYLQPSARRPV
jgi:hypothetical protein